MDSQIPLVLHSGIKTLYTDVSLIDIVIRVGARRFPCHRVVLSAMSPYFKTMFTSDFQDKTQNEVSLESVTPETFECILKYIYFSNEDVIAEDNAQDILSASCMFLIQYIQDKCESYIAERINSDNVIQLWRLAVSLNCKCLQTATKTYLLQNFEEIVKSKAFLTLQSNEFEEIIQEKDLNVSREEIVVDAVLSWFTADEDSRKNTLQSILQHVKLPLTPAYYIFHICKRFPLLTEVKELAVLVNEAKCFHSGIHLDKSSSRFSHRVSGNFMDAIVYISCQNDGLLDTYAYCPQTNKWITIQLNLKGQGPLFASCVHKNDIFLSGGVHDFSGKMLKFCKRQKCWVTLSSFGKALSRQALVATSDLLFLIGGSHGDEPFSTKIIEYNLASNRYTTIGELLSPVRTMDAVIVECNIFVFGGKKSLKGECSDGVQSFDLISRQCCIVQPCLPFSFMRTGAIVVEESILLLTVDGKVLKWTPSSTIETKIQFNASGFVERDVINKSMCYLDGKLYILHSLAMKEAYLHWCLI